MLLGSQDVRRALDEVCHMHEANLHEERGIDIAFVCTLMKETIGVEIRLEVSDVGLTELVPLQRGCVQGKGRRTGKIQTHDGCVVIQSTQAMDSWGNGHIC